MSAPSASPLRVARRLSSNNNIPARLRPTSGVLNPVHLDATGSYQKQKMKKQQQQQQYHHHRHPHQHHQNQNQNRSRNQNQNPQRHDAEEAVGLEPRYKDGYKFKQYKSYKKSWTRALKIKTTSHHDHSDYDHIQSDKGKGLSDADCDSGVLGQRKVSR